MSISPSLIAAAVLVAVLSCGPQSVAKNGVVSKEHREIWRSGSNSIVEVSCEEQSDAEDGSVTLEAHRGGQIRRASGCYPAPSFISLSWRGTFGLAGPDVILVGQSGGSAGCGDIISISFNKTIDFDTIANCPAEQAPVLVIGDVPTFDVLLALRFNGASNAGTRVGRIAIAAHRDGFRADLEAMIAAPLEGDARVMARDAIITDLHLWAAAMRDGEAGVSTPDTVETLLNLVMSARADQAHILLLEAGSVGAGPSFDAEAFWSDLCLGVVSNPLWRRFGLVRLRHADLVVAGAQHGQAQRAGLDYFVKAASAK